MCGVTIRTLITGGLKSGINIILVESLLRECNFRVSVMPLQMKMEGFFFFLEKHHLAQSMYNLRERVHPKHCVFCAFCILLCFLLLDHAND